MKNLFLPVVLAHFAFTAFADPSPDIQNNKKEAVPYLQTEDSSPKRAQSLSQRAVPHLQTEDSPPPLKEKSDISSLISAISSLTAQVKNYFYPQKDSKNSASPSAEAKPPLSSAKARNPASAKSPFRRSFAPANAPQVVFFQKKNGHLVSKCQVSVKRHPKIFPASLRNKLNDKLALANRDNNVLDLKLCPANLSGHLAKSAQHYGRETQTAMLPVVPVAAIGIGPVLACAVGGIMTFDGVRLITSDDPNAQTQGIVATIAGAALMPVLGASSANMYIPKIMRDMHPNFLLPPIVDRVVASAGLGALCSVAGGFLGYIYGRKRTK